MIGDRRIGILLLSIGLLAFLTGSVLAGSEGPVAPADPEATGNGVTQQHQIGWILGGTGVLLVLTGVIATANHKRAFF